jgi:Peptidase S46
MIRNLFLTLTSLFLFSQAIAKEGIWLPFLLETLNEKDMRAMGMKITAKDLYNENKSSLKDAVVLFGGGCTGEVISNQGLLLTNHHCGYGTVSRLSSLKNDYFKDGFWAKNTSEELPCPGLSVTFIVKIVDVTTLVTMGLSDDLRDTSRTNEVARRNKKLVKENTKDGLEASVRPFFADNKYYMFITEKFNDIRLVGFPPNSIGKFGGDTDNWAWPRHTGDFSMFRIYADKNNKAAGYDPSNKPYMPKKFFKINTSGVKPGDFTMVYGFPGRTQQNLTSSGVNEVMNILDPARIKIREEVLNIMDEDMSKDRGVFLKYANKQAGLANYYKKWKGELAGLKLNAAVDKKLVYEQEFRDWASQNSSNAKYSEAASKMEKLYSQQKENVLLNEYYKEAWGNCEALVKALELSEIVSNLEKYKSIDSIQPMMKKWTSFYQFYNKPTDKKITKKMFELMQARFPNLKNKGYSDLETIYENSMITDSAKVLALFTEKNIDAILSKINADPGYLLSDEMNTGNMNNFNEFKNIQIELIALYHTYVQGKMKKAGTKPIYPDANSTLRVSYGLVDGLRPRDGVMYDYYTTLDGVMAKENPDLEEFEVPQKLKNLWQNKDFGNYAMPNGKMPLAFIASNHSTGGNSGSPVLNANGELIGTNFDRIYEGTMSDIMYDINLCRNITLDIRYVLFIMDKFGDAGWLLKEMTIVKTPVTQVKKSTYRPK